MMITSFDFSTKFFETAFNVAKKTFLPLLGLNMLFYALLLAIFIPFFITFFAVDFSFIQEYLSLGIFERNEFIENYFMNNFTGFDPESFNPSIILTMVSIFMLVMLFAMIATSWYYNFLFHFVDDFIKTNTINFKESFSKSFSSRVFTIFFLFIIFVVVFIILEILLILLIPTLGYLHISLAILGGFIGFFFLIVFMMRFILVLPHIVNSTDSALDSIRYSFTEVSNKSALKYLAAIFVAYIVLMMVSMMLMSMKILGGVPGMVILTLLQVVFSAFTTALATSANLGLYYIYNPELIDPVEVLEESSEDLELLLEE